MLCTELLLVLFPQFPRELNILVKKQEKAKVILAKSPRHFISLVEKYNGFADISTRLYHFEPNRTYFVIDKVLFEIDSPKLSDNSFDLEAGYNEAKELVDYLRENNYMFIPVFSGNKSFHIYLLANPLTIQSEATALYVIRRAIKYFKMELDLKCIDMQLVSATHWIRVPNTLNMKSHRYATFLPQDLFGSYDRFLEAISTMTTPYCFTIMSYTGEPINLVELVFGEEIKPQEEKTLPKAKLELPRKGIKIRSREYALEIIKKFVRPCVAKLILEDLEPPHDIRTDFVSELMFAGFRPEEVEEIISYLDWVDYDPRITSYHVRKIYEKVVFPLSCYTLKYRGYCLGKACPYYPRMPYWYIYSLL